MKKNENFWKKYVDIMVKKVYYIGKKKQDKNNYEMGRWDAGNRQIWKNIGWTGKERKTFISGIR